MSNPIRIDIVSDVVCPWCAVGYHQLQKALTEIGPEAEIHWHPFELNSDMAQEGENLRHHLAAKYGSTPSQSREIRQRITDHGSELGFDFNFSDDMRMQNTFRAHQLIHWAAKQGRETDMKLALFKAYFTDGLNINDVDVLASIAKSLGLDEADALRALEQEHLGKAVREAQRFWTSQGISSVPAIIFDQKFLVPGAAGIEQFKAVLADVQKDT
ncbi:DsbA family oxidoreductase [Cohaesibacter gelatinilyticus]|uniref:Predicted dithiol-disulfide isomerase, DsbA family n=1 Tax=Cohaesibacter gelatinilyticus TaxID=372072 RepID=A0A285PFT9_9HYPH|nr:DsbA family oxidoreductase [Cohaesibacter gelatinilyticus]SNZ20590.1 Predicted dithiol-disulfide isomerase, DsbA family [Cohaesibacter gelatinilyticus]